MQPWTLTHLGSEQGNLNEHHEAPATEHNHKHLNNIEIQSKTSNIRLSNNLAQIMSNSDQQGTRQHNGVGVYQFINSVVDHLAA